METVTLPNGKTARLHNRHYDGMGRDRGFVYVRFAPRRTARVYGTTVRSLTGDLFTPDPNAKHAALVAPTTEV